MKREVASLQVERAVAERLRLTQAYDKKEAELQKQHEIVKNQLNNHKEKVRTHCDSKYPTKFNKLIANNLINELLLNCSRPKHYSKKNVSLVHVSQPKAFWRYSIRIQCMQPAKMVAHQVKMLPIINPVLQCIRNLKRGHVHSI